MESDFLVWLAFTGYYHYLGEYVGRYTEARVKAKWRKTPYHKRKCYICGRHIAYGERSVDHIIPKTVVWEMGDVHLLWDERNLALAHKLCNNIKGRRIGSLPESVQEKIKERIKYNQASGR